MVVGDPGERAALDRTVSGLVGAGVGLTIAQALVETMGGQLKVESPGAGQGSTFTFDLPAAA